MSSEVLLSVPAEFAAQIIAQSRSAGISVADTVRKLMESLQQQAAPGMHQWSDDQVVAAADLRLPPRDADRISELLNLQQAGQITTVEHAELQNLMTCYQALQLYQARALGEAIRRGLRSVPVITS
ncbi:hypothetical protein [Anatilimnocola floriformis]|uniref:hypothetical protein n=1 Tax=Anatilimnocola floriformis TaxID=2948575 RepID=UPI0020C5B321|nr:hypothetical protein [Anatilimnocola floriformis]